MRTVCSRVSTHRVRVLVALTSIACACAPSPDPPHQLADTIYLGGVIVTINEDAPTAEAVAVRDGRVLAVGTEANVMTHRDDATEIVDLEGRTMTPAFIDAHGHFIFSLQQVEQANLSSPPVGPVESIEDAIETLQAFKRERELDDDDFIIGYGYDANQLTDGRDATRNDLDPAFPTNPVLMVHVSAHGAVLNSAALERFGIDESTETPPGGIIARLPDSNEPAGLLMETAYIPVLASLPQPTEAELLDTFEMALGLYAQNGYTTVSEGATHARDLELLRKAASQGRLTLDIVALPLFTELDEILTQPNLEFGTYRDRLKLGGVKITVDGSPQGLTAFFSEPFLVDGPQGQSTWHGEPTMSQNEYEAYFQKARDAGARVYTHANGDAAIDMVLEAHERFGVEASDGLRNVVIHSQFMRPGQLDRYVEYGLTPSFFTSHAFFWGDDHVRNLGEERASWLSPMADASERGIRFSNHTDFNVTPLDPMMTIWSAVTRQSRSGRVIGASQRVEPLTALRALTIDAAYQSLEERDKGSIEPGKLADLVILSANPLSVEVDAIRDIKVLQTIKEGVTVYSRNQ